MRCQKCGASLIEGSVFCSKCGTKQPGVIQEKGIDDNGFAIAEAVHSEAENKPKKRTKRTVLIIAAAVIVVILAVILIGSGDSTDYVASVRAWKPFDVSQGLPYTCGEVFDKYIQNAEWKTSKTDGTTYVVIQGKARGTGDTVTFTVKATPNGDMLSMAPDSVSVNGNMLVDAQYEDVSAITYLFAMFGAYEINMEDLLLLPAVIAAVNEGVEGPKHFADAEIGIEFDYPGTWVPAMDPVSINDAVPGDTLVSLFAPNLPITMGFAQFYVCFGYDPYGVFVSDEVDILEANGAEVLDISEGQLSGVPALSVKYKLNGVVCNEYYYFSGGIPFKMFYNYTENISEIYSSAFQMIMESYRITAPAAVLPDYEAETFYESNAIGAPSDTGAPNSQITGQEPASRAPNHAEAMALLSEFYTGDLNSCAMSPEQAQVFATQIERELMQYPVVMASLFDGGGGIPLLWLAHGTDGTWDGNWVNGFYYIIENGYEDQIYCYRNGAAVKCPWMTKVLKTGTDGIVIQIRQDRDSEFGTHFNMYRLNDGNISADPFATGAYNPFGEAFLNGIAVDTGGEFLDEIDLYKMVDSDIEELLSASTGTSGMLILWGNWIEGADLVNALIDYAAAVQEG